MPLICVFMKCYASRQLRDGDFSLMRAASVCFSHLDQGIKNRLSVWTAVWSPWMAKGQHEINMGINIPNANSQSSVCQSCD